LSTEAANATNQLLAGIVTLSSHNIRTVGLYVMPAQGSALQIERKLGWNELEL